MTGEEPADESDLLRELQQRVFEHQMARGLPYSPTYRFPIALPLLSEHFLAIGMVAAYWSFLERQLAWLIQILVGISRDHGPALTTHIPFRVRLDIIPSLSREVVADENLREQLAALISRVRELEAKRGQIIHANWGGIDETGREVSKGRITARGQIKHSFEHMTARDIEDVASSIAILTKDLMDYSDGILDALSPSRQKRATPAP